MMKKLACSVFALLCLFLNQTSACTTFCLVGKGEVLFGRNYDWTIGDALVLVNKEARDLPRRTITAGSTGPRIRVLT
jgi:penicillin V acylase-like amidase (Ntn superfamily)